jgi:ribonuclease P protein component
VLAAPHRLRQPADFQAVIRRGARAGRSALVLHLLLADGEAGAEPPTDHVPAATPARVGFVVSGAVGNSVVRHRVTRRLRAVCAARLDDLPTGSRAVVRALPAAAAASSADLSTEFDSALRTAVRKAVR